MTLFTLNVPEVKQRYAVLFLVVSQRAPHPLKNKSLLEYLEQAALAI